jgi:hypothetical protein
MNFRNIKSRDGNDGKRQESNQRKLLISGSKVRALVRPPSKSLFFRESLDGSRQATLFGSGRNNGFWGTDRFSGRHQIGWLANPLIALAAFLPRRLWIARLAFAALAFSIRLTSLGLPALVQSAGSAPDFICGCCVGLRSLSALLRCRSARWS